MLSSHFGGCRPRATMCVLCDYNADETLRTFCRYSMTTMILPATKSASSTLNDVEHFSDISFSDYGFFDGAQNHIFENGNGSTSNISTPPANNTYSSTPASMPSSTPGSSPTPTPANYISNEGNGGDSPGSSLSSSPYPSSSGWVFLSTVLIFGITEPL